MRIAAITALCLALAGCVPSDGPQALMSVDDGYDDDAHCKSLLMKPGDLVYVQCRLAMRKTYLQSYASRKATIARAAAPTHGQVPEDVDRSLRNDAFCNYDESVKLSIQPDAEDILAVGAYDKCSATREQLQQDISAWTGADSVTFTQGERAIVIAQNVEAIREGRAVARGPNYAAGDPALAPQ